MEYRGYRHIDETLFQGERFAEQTDTFHPQDHMAPEYNTDIKDFVSRTFKYVCAEVFIRDAFVFWGATSMAGYMLMGSGGPFWLFIAVYILHTIGMGVFMVRNYISGISHLLNAARVQEAELKLRPARLPACLGLVFGLFYMISHAVLTSAALKK